MTLEAMITRPQNEDEMEAVLQDMVHDWYGACEDFADEATELPDFEVKTIGEHLGYTQPKKGIVFIQGHSAFMIEVTQIHFG